MSEPESTLLKKKALELLKQFEGIGIVARSEATKKIEPDPPALVEEAMLDKERVSWEVEHLHEDVRQTKRVNNARIVVLSSLFVLITLWIISVMVLVAFCGLHAYGFTLSDKVIMTYITSTTVSVFGLYHIAAGWLFSGKQLTKTQSGKQYPQ